MISLFRAPIAPSSSIHVRGSFDPRVQTKEVAVDDRRSERIAKVEEGLALLSPEFEQSAESGLKGTLFKLR
jgi:hypothetical protein